MKPEPPQFESWRPDVVEGLQQLGCDVTALPLLYDNSEAIEKAAKGADLLLWTGNPATKTGAYDTVKMGALLRRLEDAGTVTAALHLDLYHGIAHRQDRIGDGPWWTCQHVFTADGGPRDWGSINHHWCPPGFGTRHLGRVDPVKKYRHKACFVGTNSSRIHGSHRAMLLAWAQSTYGVGYRKYGGGSPLWGGELNRLYASADLVLGDSAHAPFYWSDRLPRTCGRGGILAHPYVEGLAQQGFTDEVMILYPRGDYNTIKARRDSMTTAEVNTMRDNAVDLIASRHTWRHTMHRLLKTAGLT